MTKAEENIGTKARCVRLATRWLPLVSGFGKIANHRKMPDLPTIEAWASLRDGGGVYCFLSDYIGNALFYFGDLDAKVSWVLKRVLREGDTFFDLGANVGILTVLGSRLVGARGRVLAVEPNPVVREMLERSIRRNSCANVQVGPYALGHESGKMSLFVPRGNVGAASLFRDSFAGPVEDEVEVDVKCLGDVLKEESWPLARLVKMDVEGAESQLLKGARPFWQKDVPPVLLFENRGKLPVENEETGQILAGLGYQFFRFPRKWFQVELIPEGEQESWRSVSHDVVAVHREADDGIWDSLGVQKMKK